MLTWHRATSKPPENVLPYFLDWNLLSIIVLHVYTSNNHNIILTRVNFEVTISPTTVILKKYCVTNVCTND